ncbi:methyltransferase [Indian peanut clump virus]|uniref:Methyltransferase n=2 Tax=Indian peanut clump virus TaxID=32629 RepID=Q82718_9VIRU|nr:methyltransferase [Indian peanut clump virus]CAA67586.1 methyltransferase [Indian peanut clump virus]
MAQSNIYSDMIDRYVNDETVVQNLFMTASSTTKSLLHDVIADRAANHLKSLEKKQKQKELVDVRRVLSSESLNALCSLYPEFNVITSNRERGSHTMAAVCRTLETLYIKSLLPVNDTVVWDVGGNWLTHVKYSTNQDVHCCCPLLDYRDAMRKQERILSLELFARNGKEKTEEFDACYQQIRNFENTRRTAISAGKNVVMNDRYCCDVFQNCAYEPDSGKLRVAMGVHSVYDMTLQELVDGLERKKIEHFIGCFLFSPKLLLGQEEGELPFVNGRFKVKKGKIRFFFLDDTTHGYEHDLNDYLEYIRKSFVVAKCGHVYMLELFSMRGDTVFFKLYDVTEYSLSKTGFLSTLLPTRDHVFKAMPIPNTDEVIVPLYWIENGEVVVERRYLPKSLVCRGMEWLMRNKANALQYETLLNYLVSTNVSAVFNGCQVREGLKTDPWILCKLAMTLLVREEFNREKQKKVLEMLRLSGSEQISLKRIFKGVFEKFFGSVSLKARVLRTVARWCGVEFGSMKYDVDVLPLYVEIEDSITLWRKGKLEGIEAYDMKDEVMRYNDKKQDVERLTQTLKDKVSEDGSASDSSSRLKKLAAFAVLASGKDTPLGRFISSRSASSNGSTETISSDQETVSPKISVPDSPTEEVPPLILPYTVKKRWADYSSDSSDDVAAGEDFMSPVSTLVLRRRLPAPPVYPNDVQEAACLEYLWYLKCKIVCDFSAMFSIVCDFKDQLLHDGRCEFPKNAFFLKVGAETKWALKRPTSQQVGHQYCVKFSENDDHMELTPVSWKKQNDEVRSIFPQGLSDGWYMFSDLTFLMNEWLIFNKLVAMYPTLQKNQLKVRLIDGVPGCGKSTWILNNCDLDKQVVLAEGREATDDLRKRFTEKGFPRKRCEERVRTVHSFMLKPLTRGFNSFHFDEALMAHAGMIYICGRMLRAREVICQGDSKQIPFINRVEQITLRYASFNVVEREYVRKTYRCPLDVIYYLNKKRYYQGDDIVGFSKTTHSVDTKSKTSGFTSLVKLPKEPVHYLTFLQAEKEEVAKHLAGVKGATVSTIHEAQGKTFECVNLVRLKMTDNELYPGGAKAEPYTIVGLTRHTRSLVYYSVVEDRLYEDISALKDVMEDQLLKCSHSEQTK